MIRCLVQRVGACSVSVFAFMLLLGCGGGKTGEDDSKSGESLSPAQADYKEFTEGDGDEIVQAITELWQYKRKREFAISRLSETLEEQGMSSSNDFDLALWKHQVEELEEDITDLETDLNRAYTAFIKMKYSPDESSKLAMTSAINGANQASRDAIKKYRVMMAGL